MAKTSDRGPTRPEAEAERGRAVCRDERLQRVRELLRTGRKVEALAEFERLFRGPDQVLPAPLAMEYARLLEANQRRVEAVLIWQQLVAAAHVPDIALDALFNLARLRAEAGAWSSARDLYEKLLRLEPGHQEGLFNLANLFYRLNDTAAARVCYRRLLALAPGHVGAWINCGKACKTGGDYPLAEVCLRRALELEPENVTAHWNLAHLLLAQGCFIEGWREYEWRFRRPEAFIPEGLDQIPAWRGEDLTGRRLLLWSEQGAGDAIQFVRFVGRLPGPPAGVTLLAPENLCRLLGAVAGINEVRPYSFLAETLFAYDLQASLLSLPFLLQLNRQEELAAAPYLRGADFTLPVNDRPVAGSGNPDSGKLNVGLVWAGNPFHANDARRSLSPAELVPLAGVEKVVFFSLQKALAVTSGALSELPFPVVDLASGFRDFADTAACLHRLDLLITVDTASAHLAGALGLPVWLLLPCEADWRWGLGGGKSYWYDSIRIFRQLAPGAWPEVLAEVAAELGKMT
ncbi:MAG: glycosyltransferase family protein [Deltaproteobacteria bacterium]|nr:glycosyltransferase family protein [Deltaproteobacteria bacterium]